MSFSTLDVTLSSKGLGETALYDKEKFTFVIGKRTFEVTKFQACFFSGRVRRLVASDATVNRVWVDVKGDSKLFKDVVSLMNGYSVTIDEENIDFLERVCLDLDNRELFDIIYNSHAENEPLSVENAVQRLHVKRKIGRAIDEEAELLALHFYEVIGKLEYLCDDDIALILENKSLKLTDEGSLLTFVTSRRDKVSGILPFLRFVRPEFLPDDRLPEYLTSAHDNGVCDVWPVICDCVRHFVHLCQDRKYELSPGRYIETREERKERERLVRMERKEKGREKLRKYLVQDEATMFKDQPYGGIIAALRSLCRGNVHDKGLVEITASGNGYSQQPYQVADRDWDDCWYSKDEKNSWIMFDFNDNVVCPTHYSIRLKKSHVGYPGEWEVSGSEDGDTWTVLDSRDTNELCGEDGGSDGEGHAFSCRSNNNSFRFLRVTQTGKNRTNGVESSCDYFWLSEVEFFGSFRPCE